ncbi:M24 family metallopeptidase [Microlunatus soli]|uniref:Ectoine hydrolase n=1 Tax=Microlunatus soli TaxID=630515 RepID=A0A1H1ZJ74_9ACTN|nr:M24 family metallopeptidase [Microlunatus soli]SDT33871.1 ectoine hydrolase [Microlunatus soli]
MSPAPLNARQLDTDPLTAAPPEEYQRRLRLVHREMSARSLAALVVADPANLYYLTGYNAWSFYMPQCLIIPADGVPHFFARAMDAAGAGFGSDLAEDRDRVHGYPEDLVHRSDVHPFDWITDRACELGLLPPDGQIAVEADANFFTARGYLALGARVGADRLVDSAELVNWVRLVKSDYEVARLRRAGTICQNAMLTAMQAVEVGMRQCDVVAQVSAAQASGTTEFGGDYPAMVPMLPTGTSAGVPHLTWNADRFVAGEATTIELCGVYQRYHAPLARTVMLGRPPQRLSRVAGIITDGMAALLDLVKPGITGDEAHAAFDAVLVRHGLTKESRVGYSIGIGYPPDWGERTVSLRRGEQTVLAENMAFHVIAGMWMDGWGYEMSEPILIGADGAERLTEVDQGLRVKR